MKTVDSELPYFELSTDEKNRIDAVRGYLCFYVLCFHFYGTYLLPHREYSGHLFSRLMVDGYIAVQIFFALSGFLIFHSFSKISRDGYQKPVTRFFVKRVFRIFPVWCVVLLIYSIDQQKFGVGEFLWNFFFLFGLKPFVFSEITVLHSWSLYVEELFYLSFPIFIVSYRKQRTVQLLLFFLVAKVLFEYFYKVPKGYLFYTPFNCFLYFGYGIGAYLALPTLRKLNLNRSFLLLAFFCISTVSIITSKRVALIEVYTLFWFLFIVKGCDGLSQPFNFLFRRIGTYCYPIYLMHMIWIWKVSHLFELLQTAIPLDPSLRLPAMFVLAVLLTGSSALFLSYVIERPCIHLGAKILKRMYPRRNDERIFNCQSPRESYEKK